MFMPPPASDQPHKLVEPEPDPVVNLSTWRPAGRWPALMRLSWLFRLFAVLSVVAGAISAVVIFWTTIIIGLSSVGPPEAKLPAFFWALVAILSAIISAIVAYFIWLGLAELILLLIAIEKSARQTRDRVGRHLHEEPHG
jgi:hypothetical protein